MKKIVSFIFLMLFYACTPGVPDDYTEGGDPLIFPDYTGVTIPYNIAPLNFRLIESDTKAIAVMEAAGNQMVITSRKGQFTFPISAWKKMLNKAKGGEITITIYEETEKQWIRYTPFAFYIADEPVDPYIAYRLIEPGYELWNKMGLYQRNLENYTETPIIENTLTDHNCMNCHSFRMQDPGTMLFHMREKHAGTYLINNGSIEKLNTKTEQTISPLVYPSWHPSGNFVAFSVNDIKQSFHHHDSNRIEVFDLKSDVVVYDVRNHEIITTGLLTQKESFETFPTFSPDGRTLYFCTSEAREMPADYKKAKYSLCSIAFDPEKRTFGSAVDTLFSAPANGKSVSFPRVSPDGKYLMYTLSEYGNFSIWHQDADLFMIDLTTGLHYPLSALNSESVESYHSWSSNSRWVVFSSRRLDGLYTRPHITYIDKEGQPSKPFLLPQKSTFFYDNLMTSYNIPEFVKGKVEISRRKISETAKKEKGVDVSFAIQ